MSQEHYAKMRKIVKLLRDESYEEEAKELEDIIEYFEVFIGDNNPPSKEIIEESVPSSEESMRAKHIRQSNNGFLDENNADWQDFWERDRFGG